MAKNKKTFDDMNEDPRFLAVQKKAKEFQGSSCPKSLYSLITIVISKRKLSPFRMMAVHNFNEWKDMALPSIKEIFDED